MKGINFDKVYGHLGKVLCGLAGGVIGFISGFYWVIPGIILGILVGYVLESKISKPVKDRK